MPIYTYQCRTCGARVDLWLRTWDEVPICPRCGSTDLEKQVTAAYVSAGQTAQRPGRTCCGREERCDAPPCSAGGRCWR
ncbi:MAG: FmdB family zinc ribbon protein [Anaerolineae bacterium]